MSGESEMMEQARRALREERPDDAQAILVNVVVRAPENDEAWLLLATTLDDPQRKLECLERARAANPRNPAIRRAIQELKQSFASAAFGVASPAAPPDHSALVVPLLEQAETVVRRVLFTTEPSDTRQSGLELVALLEQAARHDETQTRRWARTAGRQALVKFEKALTNYITGLPQTDPAVAPLREQRQRALNLLR
jgi:hypothetical protein